MTDSTSFVQHDRVIQAILTKDRTVRAVRVIRCDCKTKVATVYVWLDGRRYLWKPSDSMRLAETGGFVRTPPILVGLDDGDEWEPQLAVCRCGRGFLLSCHKTNTTDYPEGAAYARFSTDRDAPAAPGDALIGWNLSGARHVRIAEGLHLVELGKGITATLNP